MMTGMYPYTMIAEDPTTQVLLSWIDERDSADGSEQTMAINGETVTTTGELIPASDAIDGCDGAYRYAGEVIDGLSPGTEYAVEINGETVGTTFTLPDSWDGYEDGQMRLVLTSDWHIEGRNDYKHDPEDVQHMADHEPHVFVFFGDYITSSFNMEAEDAAEWLRLFREYYYDHLYDDGDRLMPAFHLPGNHEVGNHHWVGDDRNVDPQTGYFQFFFESPTYLDPAGTNFGAVTVGDYLQLVGLDTHSARLDTDTTPWLEGGVLDDTVDHIIAVQHAALLPGGDRRHTDFEYGEKMLDAFGDRYYQQDNLRAVFAGNVHSLKKTHPWKITDEEPAGEPGEAYIELNGGEYVALAEDDDPLAVVEFGDGYNPNRWDPDVAEKWYLARSSKTGAHYDLTLSEDRYEVNEIDTAGRTLTSERLV